MVTQYALNRAESLEVNIFYIFLLCGTEITTNRTNKQRIKKKKKSMKKPVHLVRFTLCPEEGDFLGEGLFKEHLWNVPFLQDSTKMQVI